MIVRGGCICNGCGVAVEPVQFVAYTATKDNPPVFYLAVLIRFTDFN
jgi:hypothetical protein